MSKKAILVITDGIGYSPKTTYNAFHHAKKPTYEYLLNNIPYSMIRTYGLSVGLPDSQMGNSEVGHMCIGSGRVLYQDLVRISLALQNDEIKSNQAFTSVANNCQTIHIGGLLSDGGVHSHISHLLGIAEICAKMQKQVFLHLITDGRDVLPQSALGYLDSIQSLCEKYDTIRVASLSGRFYAMDRDKRWERIEQAYNEMVCAKTPTTLSPSEYVKSQYKQGIFDEFITPVSFAPFSGMQDNEGFIFINFRSDRARQILQVLGDESFSGFARAKAPRLQIATMCEYDASFTFPVLFSKEKITNTLAEVISKQGLRQFHTAETEKYAHITFFLNGGREEEFSGEKRELIPSPKVKTYDLQPQMSAPQVGDALLGAMREGYDFIVVNFANGDMVGHTGNFEAGVKAVEAVDTELGRILELAKELDYSVVITSDHGNCEEMKDDRGNTLTNHTVGDVWCFIVDKEVKQLKASGGLDNIAPSVLKLMGLPAPQEMSEPLF